jgi:hypothetical protein
VRITEDELDALPPKLSQLIRALFVPTDGKMYVPNHGMNVIRLNCYLNHSTKPNMPRERAHHTICSKPHANARIR